MGWLTDITTWAKRIWRHDATAATANYSYKTMVYTFDQLAAIPRVVRSVVMHPPTRTVATHLLQVTLTDLVPLVFVSYFNDRVQEYARDYIDDPATNHDEWLNPKLAIEASLYVLGALTWAIRTNRKLELIARMAVINLEASALLPGIKSTPPMTACVNRCPPMLKGPVSNYVGYWAAEGFIQLVHHVPIVGGPLAAVLDIYHNGHYILTLAMPDLCNDHLAIYLREHPEISLSLGLGHATSVWVLSSLAEKFTGIPAHLYANGAKRLMIVTQTAVTMHLHLPAPQKTSSRARHPVLFLQDTVDVATEIILLGMEKKISRLLERKESGNFQLISREQVWGMLSKLSKHAHHNRLVQQILPSLLRNPTLFIQDPITRSTWPTVQSELLNAIKIIESLPNRLAVQALSAVPNATSTLIETVFGTPKYATKLLLQLIMDPGVIDALKTLRYAIEKLEVDVFVPIISDSDTLLLAGQEVINKPASRVRLDSASSPPRDNVIRLADTSATTTLPKPRHVIRLADPTNLALPAPASVIRHRHRFLPAPAPQDTDELTGDWTHIFNTSEYGM